MGVLDTTDTALEYLNESEQVLSFDSDGFSLGDNDPHESFYVNRTGQTYAAWNWKGGGAAVSNGDGSITSSVSANTTAGFSIVSYGGENTQSTVGHGLSQAVELIILKSTTLTEAWHVGSTPQNWTTKILLNTDAAQVTNDCWQDTAPTSSVFSLDYDSGVNQSGDSYVAYCFHSVEGYSKVGSYAGNANNDGTFIYTGFKPAFVLAKSYDYAYNWPMVDNKRGPYNVITKGLAADVSDVELDNVANSIDFVSNGFKLRNSHTMFNGSHNYIYLAFAESPFKTSNAR